MGEKESGPKISGNIGASCTGLTPSQCWSDVTRPLVTFCLDCHLVIANLSVAQRWSGDRCDAGNGPASTNGNIIACNPN